MINYLRFAAMIATSTVVMFGLMYLNTYQFGHALYSETRTYMALLMGACMAIIMLTFMLGMYDNRRINIGIYMTSAVVFALSLWLVRSQSTVEDVSYMRAMIPHHSIAIMTSKRANLSDPRVRQLADEIIAAQEREIAEMKVLIASLEQSSNTVDDSPSSDASQQAGSTRSKPDHTNAKQANEVLIGTKVPAPDPAAAKVPADFRVEVVLSNLDYPTSVEFDDEGSMFVAEAGYSYGDDLPKPRIFKVSGEGEITVAAEGDGLNGPINDLLWYQDQLYISHRGKISTLDSEGTLTDLVVDLPSTGDHHNNQLTVGPDGKIYFGQGTATNSGVVGIDNFKMGWLKDHPDFHDHPAEEISLTGRTFETVNPLNTEGQQVETSPFHSFSNVASEEATVPAVVKANGTIMRMESDGSQLEVYAWGLRNPYGLMWDVSKDTLYASENGFDVRGSRPIANDQEDLYVIKENSWYGWPDYAMGKPITDPQFKTKEGSQPKFLLADHPPVEQPWLNFPKHSAIAKIEFSTSEAFGQGEMFVAFFGHMSPMTGEAPEQHGGHRVVRIDPRTKRSETFFGKHDDHHHDESSSSAGPRRLLDVRFSPEGKALYIADFGTMEVENGPQPVPGTGVIWRVVPKESEGHQPPAKLSIAD